MVTGFGEKPAVVQISLPRRDLASFIGYHLDSGQLGAGRRLSLPIAEIL
jgi:hypothetical protein